MMNEPSLRSARLCAAASLVLFVAVLIAGGLRSAAEPAEGPAVTPAPEEGIAVFAADRNQLREREILGLEKICEDPASSEEIRSAAQSRIMELRKWMEQEATIEAVLNARGYELPVVTVHSDSVNVVVRAGTLERTEAGVILELVMRETGVTGGNVKIIPIN